jgi:hypothetical protein
MDPKINHNEERALVSLKLITALILVFFLTACLKKKMEKIEGIYVGQERYVHMYGSTTDTLSDTLFDQIITVKLHNNEFYKFTKTIDSTTFEFPSKRLARNGTQTKTEGLIPLITTKLTADGDYLSYEIVENNGWTGSYNHYYFTGYKK